MTITHDDITPPLCFFCNSEAEKRTGAGSKVPFYVVQHNGGCPLLLLADPNSYESGAVYELRQWHEFNALAKLLVTRKNFASGTQKEENIIDELSSLVNRYSLENESNTPDFILAQFLRDAMKAYGAALTLRDRWFGIDPWNKGSVKEQAPF